MATRCRMTSGFFFLSPLLLASSAGLSNASSEVFLKVHRETSLEILGGLEAAFGQQFRQDVEQRITGAEMDLNTTFLALPKNSKGRLSPPTVRYILHRQLLRGRAWHLKGIDPEGQAWDAASPTTALEDIAPAGLKSLFESHLSRRGLNLRETALMLAVLEKLVLQDGLRRVTNAYLADGLRVEDNQTYTQIQRALETFMRSVVLGPREAKAMSPRVVAKLWTYNMTDMYPGWPRTMDWVRNLEKRWLKNDTKTVDHSKDGATEEFAHPFDDVKKVVSEVSESYGVWQNAECRNLKQVLLNMEDADCPGRVTLAQFWDSALHGGRWQFTESKEYLRASGALDETDPQFPSIIVPNYMTSYTNCVASSGFFTTCCMDECEPILRRLEEEIGSPVAKPADIANIVSQIVTVDQPARDALPQNLLQQLENIARMHGGRVPLHGRLFAQWLHHAFPRECNYPAVANTTSPKHHLDWKEETGSAPEASRLEMMTYTNSHRFGKSLQSRRLGGEVGGRWNEARKCSTWSMTEELVAPILQEGSLAWDEGRGDFSLDSALIPAAALMSATMLSFVAKAWRAPPGNPFGGINALDI